MARLADPFWCGNTLSWRRTVEAYGNGAIPPGDAQKQAEARLRDSGYSALRHVSCQFHDGALVLRGSVPTHYLKQLAQHLVTGLDAVAQVENHIEVTPLRHVPEKGEFPSS
jgi:osmotically-inducible protein OsmY